MRRIGFLVFLLSVTVIIGNAFASSQKVSSGCGKVMHAMDGLLTQPWFIHEPFVDLWLELFYARKNNKRLVVIFDVPGNPYSRKMHYQYFSDCKVHKYIKDRFEIIVINNRNKDGMIKDFNGKVIRIRDFIKKHKAYFTPGFLFFEESFNPYKESGVVLEIWGLNSDKKIFYRMFKYVFQKIYKKEKFIQYIQK